MTSMQSAMMIHQYIDDNQFQVQMETFSEYCKELVIISVCTIAQKQLHGSHRVSKIDFGDASDKLNI